MTRKRRSFVFLNILFVLVTLGLALLLQPKDDILIAAQLTTNGAGINIGHRTCPPQCKCDLQTIHPSSVYPKTVRCNDAPPLSEIDFSLIDSDISTLEIVHSHTISAAVHKGYLPPIFGRFPMLSRLLIRRGAIQSIPLETTLQLQSIRTLDLRLNSIRSLEPLNLERMPQIELLDLSDNAIEEIKVLPLGYLRMLQVLGLGGNQLLSLEAPALNNKPLLFYVSLADNKLSYLSDDTFDGLPRLETLDMSNNQFTTLPNGVEKLKSLQELRLDSNRLTTLTTTELQQLETLGPTLKHVTLHDNPLYCDVRIAALLQYMRTTVLGRSRFCSRTTAPQCPTCFLPVRFHNRQVADVSLGELGVETGTAEPPQVMGPPTPPTSPSVADALSTLSNVLVVPGTVTSPTVWAMPAAAVTPSSLAVIVVSGTGSTAIPPVTAVPSPTSAVDCPCAVPSTVLQVAAPASTSAAAPTAAASVPTTAAISSLAAAAATATIPWFDVSRSNAIEYALEMLGLRPRSAIVSLEAVAAPLQANEMRPPDLICMRLPGVRCSNETNACYLFASATSATESWDNARFACQLFGFDLVTFDDEKDQMTVITFLREVIVEDGTRRSPSRGWWIGMRRATAGGPFLSVDKLTEAAAGTAKWGPSQPNNFAGDENCAEMWDTGEWNDIKCDANIKNLFICKKKRPPLPAPPAGAATMGPALPPGR